MSFVCFPWVLGLGSWVSGLRVCLNHFPVLCPAGHGPCHDTSPFLSSWCLCDLPQQSAIVHNRPSLEGLVERAVSSTYLGALPAPRAATASSAGRAGWLFFLILSPSPHLITGPQHYSQRRYRFPSQRRTLGLSFRKWRSSHRIPECVRSGNLMVAFAGLHRATTPSLRDRAFLRRARTAITELDGTRSNSC